MFYLYLVLFMPFINGLIKNIQNTQWSNYIICPNRKKKKALSPTDDIFRVTEIKKTKQKTRNDV